MAKLISWMKAHRPSQRRLVQLYAAVLYNAHVKGFIKGEIYTGPAKALCVPGLNCYLGRTVCGWLCPVGWIQELLHKLPLPKIKKGRWSRSLGLLRYWVLGMFVVAMPLWYAVKDVPLPAFCKYVCPAGTLEGARNLLAHPQNADLFSMLGLLFTRKWIILILFIVSAAFIYRAFCRFVCPLGAIYGLFNRVSLLGVRVEAASCSQCGRCVSVCKMDVRRVGDAGCIHCGECIDACPDKAIRFMAGKWVLKKNEITKEASANEKS